MPNVRAKPGPMDGCLAGTADDRHARLRRPGMRPLGLGLSEGLGFNPQARGKFFEGLPFFQECALRFSR